MKLPCNIVQDLLPLYEDGLCSEESRIAIEEHLKECESCRTLFEQLQILSKPELPIQLPLEEQAVKKTFRKIRRKWGLSMISLLLIIPLVFFSVNQYRGIGICFTNIDEIIAAGEYACALAKGDYEKAAACMDYEGLYEEILDLLEMECPPDVGMDAKEWYQYIETTYSEVADMSLTEFTEHVQSTYTKDLHSITNLGITFSSAGYNDSYLIEDEWNITYKIMVTVDGQTYPLYLDFRIGNNGLRMPSMSHPFDFPGNEEMTEALFLHYAL